MDYPVAEAKYPIDFREDEATRLGDYLQQCQSVELIGMKRVGINNFLRFFLFHKNIKQKYMPQDGKNLFIFVDLNDLIERELFSFWRLTLKRIVDAVEASELSSEIKQKVSSIFLTCIQSGDFFLTYDGVKESVALLAKNDVYPTIFLSRFDRIKDAVSLEFFDNLQSLKDAAHQKLSYIFTSFRELSQIAPSVFDKKSLAVFSHVVAIKPCSVKDMKSIMQTLADMYQTTVPESFAGKIIELSGGHAQYLQLSLIILRELQKNPNVSVEDFLAQVHTDERITLLSEELWESLTDEEKTVLQRVAHNKQVTPAEMEQAKYLWDVGFITQQTLFSPLFAEYVISQEGTNENASVELSKKEHALFTLLEKTLNDICERERIVEVVWPEYKEYGVSDWSIDRLVARVRNKLKKQKSEYEIVTIRTRGYKLTTA